VPIRERAGALLGALLREAAAGASEKPDGGAMSSDKIRPEQPHPPGLRLCPPVHR
jgi:hypothetical protein